jgi:hypothetical protein
MILKSLGGEDRYECGRRSKINSRSSATFCCAVLAKVYGCANQLFQILILGTLPFNPCSFITSALYVFTLTFLNAYAVLGFKAHP